MASAGSAPEGLSVTGSLRGGRLEEGRPRTDGDGKWPDRYILAVGAGDDVFRVEYASELDARDAVGSGANVGDIVTVPVSVRAAKGYIFYMGRGSAPASDSLTW